MPKNWCLSNTGALTVHQMRKIYKLYLKTKSFLVHVCNFDNQNIQMTNWQYCRLKYISVRKSMRSRRYAGHVTISKNVQDYKNVRIHTDISILLANMHFEENPVIQIAPRVL